MLNHQDLINLSRYCDLAIRQGGAEAALVALPIMDKLRQMIQAQQSTLQGQFPRPVSMPRPNGNADEPQPST